MKPIFALTLCLSLAATASAQVPYFQERAVFARDTTPGGSPLFYGLPGDVDALQGSTPSNVHQNFTRDYDGASIQHVANTLYGGFFAARNQVSLNITNVQAQGYYSVAGRGSHTTVEFFTPGAIADSSVFHWHVTGSSSASYGQATSRIDFLAGSYPTTAFNDFFAESHMTGFGPGDYTYTLAAGLNQPIDLFYWTSAFIQVNDDLTPAHVGESFSAFSDYSNTYVLESIDLFDATGAPITNWSMVDTSTGLTVFTEAGRTAAANATAPEPGTLALLTLGGTLIVVRRRRQP